MRVTLLGTGTSTGVPVIGCRCAVCTSDKKENKRLRTSLAVTDSRDETLVFDTGPEFRLQMLHANITKIAAVLYTHVHADHCHGFDDLRAFSFSVREKIPCFLGTEHMEEFRTRFAYAFEETGYLGSKPLVELKVIPETAFKIGDSFELEPVKLPHGHSLTYGFRLGRSAYATDFKQFSRAQIASWQGKIDVMVASGIHFGQHKTHSVIPETIDLFKSLGVQRGVITHMAHDVDHFRDSGRLPAGVEFGCDGMVIDV